LASIQEQLLFKSGIFKIRTEHEEIHCFKEGGVTADTRESIWRDTATFMVTLQRIPSLRNQTPLQMLKRTEMS